jgi:fructose-bisphosphate aldolase/6-deoxy-5-ketofructose 1-phosphate synthase
MNLSIPLDVASSARLTYEANMERITYGTGRLFLFAGDQKLEHMNDDYFGADTHPDDANPEHLFRIASKAKVGAFASQMGLIARYGADYKDIPYIVKMNAKTDRVKTEQADPISRQWQTTEQLMKFKKQSGLNIVGIGYTIYPGSENESVMYREAAQLIFEAHQQGLVTVIWAYARGKAIKNEKDPHISAGCAGIGACLGTDFVKVNPPKSETVSQGEALKESVQAAGRTGVICAGGSSQPIPEFLQTLHDQIHIAGCRGNATGRNIHQRSLGDAVKLCDAIHAITNEDVSVEKALSIINS